MTIVWVIGLILSLLGIYLFKGSRVKAPKSYWGEKSKPERPVLKIWSLALYIMGALLPIFSIFMGTTMIVVWMVNVYGENSWIIKNGSIIDKVVWFLNKPV